MNNLYLVVRDNDTNISVLSHYIVDVLDIDTVGDALVHFRDIIRRESEIRIWGEGRSLLRYLRDDNCICVHDSLSYMVYIVYNYADSKQWKHSIMNDCISSYVKDLRNSIIDDILNTDG